MHWATYLKWKQSLEAWCLLVMFGERAPLSCWFGPLKMQIPSCYRVHLCFHPGGSSISQQAMKLGRVSQHVSSYGWNPDNWSSPPTGNATDQPSKPLSRPGIAKSLQAMLPFVYQQSCSVLHSPMLWSAALQSMDKGTQVKVLSFIGYRNILKWWKTASTCEVYRFFWILSDRLSMDDLTTTLWWQQLFMSFEVLPTKHIMS